MISKSIITSNALTKGISYFRIAFFSFFLLSVFSFASVKCLGNNECVSEVDSLNDLAFEKREIDKQAAFVLIEHAMALSSKCGYKEGLATSYNIIGIVLRIDGKYDKAMAYFDKSLKIKSLLSDSIGIAGVFNNIGVLKREEGRYNQAINYFHLAADIFEKVPDAKIKHANVLSNLSNAYQHEGDINKAIIFNEACLKIYQSLGDEYELAKSKYNLASKYLLKRRLDEANSLLVEALNFFKKEKEWESHSLALDLLGQVEMENQNYQQSMEFFQMAIDLYRANDDMNFGLLTTYGNLGELYLRMNNPHEAILSLNRADNIMKNRGGLEDKKMLYDAFARCYNALSKFDSAYYYQTESKRFQDSIYSKDKAIAIAEMQTKYETAEKERLASEAQLKATQATARSRTFLSLFLAALAVAAATFFYFRHRQRTAALIAKQQEQLHLKEVEELLRDQEIKSINAVLEGQEGERVRIAKDLHDRLGSMLTTVKWSFDGYLEGSTDKQDLTPLLKANRLLDDAYQEVRRISHDMVSGVLTKFGLVPAVEELCNAVNASGRLDVKLVVFGMEQRPDNQVEITLYRVIQELMSNILKHAKASTVTIQISRIEDELNVTVEDNGQGFDPISIKSGMGLKNVEARVRGINGTVFFDTGKGNGTSVLIEVPV